MDRFYRNATLGFFALNETAPNSSRLRPSQVHSLKNAIRGSLVNLRGSTLPNLQPSSEWREFELTEESELKFYFNRPPHGQFRFIAGNSFESTREFLEEEWSGGSLSLEELTWELFLALEFFDRLARTQKFEGTFRIGMFLNGVRETTVDWSGFTRLGEELTHGQVWRFSHGAANTSYEVAKVRFPVVKKAELDSAVARVLTQFSEVIYGSPSFSDRLRPSRSQTVTLDLDPDSVKGVIKNIRKALEKRAERRA
jgi:hypothetical protein